MNHFPMTYNGVKRNKKKRKLDETHEDINKLVAVLEKTDDK